VRPRLRLRVGRRQAFAELVRGERVLWAGSAPFTTPEELEEAVSQLAAQEALPARPAGLRVELEAPLSQVRTLQGLPPLRAGQLRGLVATQAGRFFRRNGKPLVTDACWSGRDGRRKGIAVAAAGEEHWIEAVIGGARCAGLSVETLGPAAVPQGVWLDLTPPAERRRRREEARLSIRRLALAACLAWAAAAAVFGLRLRGERLAVDRELARLEQPATAVAAARRSLSEAARLVETLDRAERDRVRLLAQFAALTAALPDSAFLTAFALDDAGRGEMSIVARRSSEVFAALDRADAGASPRLGGALVRETIGGREWERFTVAFGAERKW
jgi:hypothetical protein